MSASPLYAGGACEVPLQQGVSTESRNRAILLPPSSERPCFSRERSLHTVIRNDGIPRVLGLHSLPSKINGSLTASPSALLLR